MKLKDLKGFPESNEIPNKYLNSEPEMFIYLQIKKEILSEIGNLEISLDMEG